MKFTIDNTDLVFFPFTDAEMDQGIAYEEFMMNNMTDMADVANAGENPQWNSRTGHLYIFGHGTQSSAHKHKISGGRGPSKTAPEVAKMIKDMGFPTGSTNEIIVWSCHSGVVGGFAQMLTLHLINEGYTGKKVWGCKTYTGVVKTNKRLRVSDSERSSRVIRYATGADVSYYFGSGSPLASSASAS